MQPPPTPPGGPPDVPGYDQALKWMLNQAPQAVLDLLQPGLTWQGKCSPEPPAVAHFITETLEQVRTRLGL